jgi:hypothetical protein
MYPKYLKRIARLCRKEGLARDEAQRRICAEIKAAKRRVLEAASRLHQQEGAEETGSPLTSTIPSAPSVPSCSNKRNGRERRAAANRPATKETGLISPADQWCIEIDVTNACPHACANCTRFTCLVPKPFTMDLPTFQRAVDSMEGYAGVLGIMGGEPTLHPHFGDLIEYYREHWHPEEEGRRERGRGGEEERRREGEGEGRSPTSAATSRPTR